MGHTVRVRQGGDAVAAWRDYTSMVPTFEGVEGGSPTPALRGGNSLGGGQGEFKIIDDASLIPANPPDNSIAAHNVVEWYDDGPGFNCWMMRGRIGNKDADRGDHPWGDSRTWSVQVVDAQSDIFGLDLDADWVRPAETGIARVQAALTAFCNGSPRVSTVISQHLISSAGGVSMPAKTYTASSALREIFEDCATTEGKIYGVVIHHRSSASHLCFLYIDELDHTTYRSILRISDVPSEHDLTGSNLLLNLAGASIKVSSENASFPKTNAVDGDINTLWSAVASGSVANDYIAGDLGSAQTAYGFRIRIADTLDYASAISVYGSNDAAAWTWLPAGKISADPAANGWTLIKSLSGLAFQQDTGKVGFGEQSYRYWLFRATDGPTDPGSDWDIGEVELLGDVTLPPEWIGTPSSEVGDHLASKLVSRWGNGNTVVSDLGASQVDAYDYWSRGYQDAVSVNATQAAARAAAVLGDWRYEHVTHQVTILIPSTMLDMVTTGMSIQIRAAAAMGGQYLGTWQTRRVAAHKFEPAAPGPDAATRLYKVHLELDRPMRTTGSGVVSGAGVSAASKALLAATGVKHNFTATTAPTTGDDADDGYSVGSQWFNTVTDQGYVLLDATVGAAVWQGLTAGVTDHGALTGLADDDHSAYVTVTGGGGETVSTVAASGATETLDLTSGNVHDVTLDANCTFTFTGATNGVGCSMLLLLRQDGTGSRTATWPGSVVWPDGIAPTLATGAGEVDVLTFFTRDGGTTWYGFHATGGIGSPDDVRDAGRWEVVVAGSAPPVAVSTPSDDDWVYAWVS